MVVKLVMVVDPMLEEVGRPMAICQKADAASDAWSTWWCAFYDKPKMCRITLWHKFDDDDHEHDDDGAHSDNNDINDDIADSKVRHHYWSNSYRKLDRVIRYFYGRTHYSKSG